LNAILFTLRAKLCSVLYSPVFVCLCICLFVGPPYNSQCTVFALPLSTFSLLIVLILKHVKIIFPPALFNVHENDCSLVKRRTFEDEPQCQRANMQQPTAL